MIYTDKIQKAIRFSIKTHEVYQKQKRKGKDIPYIVHPLTVGFILSRAGANEDTVVAGILHDTIEDSVPEKKVTKKMLAERFGKEVANLVGSVTEQDKTLSWEERKKEALEHIKAFSHNSLLVKSADIISNTSELIEDQERDGDKVFARFNAPKEKLLQHYLRVIDAIIEQWTESPLAGDLQFIAVAIMKLTTVQNGIFLGAFEVEKPWRVEVYLINNTDAFLIGEKQQGSIQSDDDTFLDLGHSTWKRLEVAPSTAVKIDQMDDGGELDFHTWYNVKIKDKVLSASIGGSRFYFGPRSKEQLPILNRIGYLDTFTD